VAQSELESSGGSERACGICRLNAAGGELFANPLWLVQRVPRGIGVPGWVMICARRHVAGIAHFSDAEAVAFGPALRHFACVLEQVSGALRIYTAALGEAAPHFHAHLVPRYAQMPRGALGWSVFDLYRATAQGEVALDEAEADRVARAYQQALARHPPP
jgi:diadenosine tetraphosphate (Ap4A) HIT family hydrolase